jgi:hypothetical protein
MPTIRCVQPFPFQAAGLLGHDACLAAASGHLSLNGPRRISHSATLQSRYPACMTGFTISFMAIYL